MTVSTHVNTATATNYFIDSQKLEDEDSFTYFIYFIGSKTTY